jgi:hypothetical protein
MLEACLGPPEEEGRMRVGDTGVRFIIMWISKGWTTHELKLPVFYREALARLLALGNSGILSRQTSRPASLYTPITNPHYSRTVYLTRGNSARGNSQRYPTSTNDSSIENIPFGDRKPVISEGTLKWKRIPREPIPRISDFKLWVGRQLRNKNLPSKYQHMHPEGELIAIDITYPEGLWQYQTPKDISE